MLHVCECVNIEWDDAVFGYPRAKTNARDFYVGKCNMEHKLEIIESIA